MPDDEIEASEAGVGDLVACIAENRRNCEPALRILLASLEFHCPGLKVALYCPNASEAFSAWVGKRENVDRHDIPPGKAWNKYDIKPVVLLDLLDKGLGNLVWIDSDILISADFRPLFATFPDDAVAVSEEALCSSHADPDGLRARLWGMDVGRSMPFCLNSGVVRVTHRHRALLETWARLLESHVYRDAQERPWQERGLHVLGDQEVLTALLSSSAFAHIPLRLLRRGRHIIQYFGSSGYTLAERFRHLWSGLPLFVHSQGFRPWWPREEARDPRGRWQRLYNDLSPYTLLARRHASALDDRSWLRSPTLLVAALRGLAFGKAPLIGLPLALVADLVRWGRQWSRARDRSRDGAGGPGDVHG